MWTLLCKIPPSDIPKADLVIFIEKIEMWQRLERIGGLVESFDPGAMDELFRPIEVVEKESPAALDKEVTAE